MTLDGTVFSPTRHLLSRRQPVGCFGTSCTAGYRSGPISIGAGCFQNGDRTICLQPHCRSQRHNAFIQTSPILIAERHIRSIRRSHCSTGIRRSSGARRIILLSVLDILRGAVVGGSTVRRRHGQPKKNSSLFPPGGISPSYRRLTHPSRRGRSEVWWRFCGLSCRRAFSTRRGSVMGIRSKTGTIPFQHLAVSSCNRLRSGPSMKTSCPSSVWPTSRAMWHDSFPTIARGSPQLPHDSSTRTRKTRKELPSTCLGSILSN